MSAAAALLGLYGLGVGVGGILLVAILSGSAPRDVPTRPSRWQRFVERMRREEHLGRWVAAAGVMGALTGLFTGWVVGAVLAAMATWGVPRALGRDPVEHQRAERIEGTAGWTEMLRDTLAAAAGLEQTIVATALTAPEPVRPYVVDLVARLERGDHLPSALRRMGDELDDPVADLVIGALVLASEHQGRQLAPLLGQLAATARSQVAMRQRVETSRARMRTTVRVVVTTTVGFAVGLVVLNRSFLTPYDTATGQLVLMGIGALFTVSFGWLRRMARIEEPDRFLGGGEDDVGRSQATNLEEATQQ
ncbi:type II secretion system F family protein [Streptomyces sp. NPDC059009]|uniref:type II secretion system F family protein n=1 Tax=Streptomyces sp. NPDC059009 TaxID=3346694 RepID=UPI003676BEEE